ncbi:MAG: metallophosphoesterase [Methanomethylophilus sp.]
MELLQPVPGLPALRLDDSLVIGDLHIGVESHLVSKGFHLSSRTDDMYDRIRAAAGSEVRRIIMIGDVKDSVPGSTRQEYREIPAFCDRLLETFDQVDIVRGNHDTSIEEFVPGQVRVWPASGAVIDGVGLIHGHTWPSPEVMAAEHLVMGHEHPTVMFADSVGAHMTEPCWLRGRFREPREGDRYPKLPQQFIVVPSFNKLLGGSPVNIIGQPLLGPLLNSDLVDLDTAEIFLLDGIDLGRRSDLMVKGRNYDRWDDREDVPRHKKL